MKKQHQQGFTIIELLIATTVFSLVLVLCLGAFLRVGQLYYKGIYLAKTQQIARDTSDDMVNQLRQNGAHTTLGSVALPSGQKIYFICIGSKRYSFVSGYVVGSSAEDTTHFGLVRDDYASPAPCLSPTDPTAPWSANHTELLTDEMRMIATGTGIGQSDLNDVCANTPTISTLSCVHIHIDFGDVSLLDDATKSGATCTGPLSGSQFCATTTLETTVSPLQ